jgi:hypothetical protein
MKLRVAWRNIVHYVRTDLKEIAFPSSLPDPPSSKPKPRKLTIREHLQVWKIGSYEYFRSWRTGTLDDEEEEKKEDDSVKNREKASEEPSILEELALASRAGSEKLRPALQRVYMTRASAYRDALQSFVQGYQEGIAEVMRGTNAMNDSVEREGYSEGGEGNHQSNVAPPSEGESKKEQHHERGMKI